MRWVRWSVCTDTSEQETVRGLNCCYHSCQINPPPNVPLCCFLDTVQIHEVFFFVMRVVNWCFIAQDSVYTDQFSAPLCKWTAPVLTMALVCAVWARWVLDWSLDPCYLGEFSGLIIKLVFIFALICGIIILICMYLPGLLSQAIFLAVSEPD